MKLRILRILCFLMAFYSCGDPKIEKIQLNSGNSASKDRSTIVETSSSPEEDPKKENKEIDSVKKSSMSDEQLNKAEAIMESADKGLIASLNAEMIYKKHCMTCHGSKGNMNLNGAKDLSLSRIDMKERVAQIYYGKGLMTAYSSILSEEEILAVSNYIEGLRK